jgi:hypothetical protein
MCITVFSRDSQSPAWSFAQPEKIKVPVQAHVGAEDKFFPAEVGYERIHTDRTTLVGVYRKF